MPQDIIYSQSFLILAGQVIVAQNREPRTHKTSKVNLFIECFSWAHIEKKKKGVFSLNSALTIGYQQNEEWNFFWCYTTYKKLTQVG